MSLWHCHMNGTYYMNHIIWLVDNPSHGSFIDIWYNSLVHDELMEWTNKRSSRVTNKMHSDLISFQHSIPWFNDCHQFVTNFHNDNGVFDALIKKQYKKVNPEQWKFFLTESNQLNKKTANRITNHVFISLGFIWRV